VTIDDVLESLREQNAVLVVNGERLRYVGAAPLAPDDPLRAGIAEHRAELIIMVTPTPPAPVPTEPADPQASSGLSSVTPPTAHPLANRGMLMTLGRRYGYPPLPLKPGVSIAEGYPSWRTFTSTAPTDMLALAAEAARSIWSDDPMANDLYYVTPDDGDDQPAGCCTESQPCPDHFDDVFEAHRNGKEDDYLEHGRSGDAA
jgi:hypothetical protein